MASPFNNYTEVSALGNNTTWKNGIFNRQFFAAPSLKTILGNMKRVIIQNQVAVFRLICENEGVNFLETSDTPDKGVKIFKETSIHFGNIDDPGEHSILMDAQVTNSNINSNGRFDNYQIKFTINTGANKNSDLAYEFATIYLTAIQTIIEAMDPNELWFKWPGTKYGNPKVAFGLSGDLSNAPTVISLNQKTGVSPELIFNFTVFPVRIRTAV
jgi:hypothetical protein